MTEQCKVSCWARRYSSGRAISLNARTNDWLWNIYEFTRGDSGTYRWNCWYEDAETGEIPGGNFIEYTFLETPSGTPVDSSTGRGEVYLDSSAGAIENLVVVSPDDML